ncbi:hypothetical protein Tco_0974385 [Tanacetum coccineum]|uniref:Tf2-1-like SH3-like domain-containing protein n=1 Tax=Tanacetum coccineum TaxID=301880 RepID=A0ABQ5EBE7_9ASTR
MARYGSRHRHLYQQVLDVFKNEGRISEAIRFTGTTRNTPLEMGKYSHGFYHKPAKDNKLLLHDLGNRDHQKNNADVRRKPLEFQVGGKVVMKVSLWKGVLHFGKQEKLNPRYIGPFKILAKKCLSDETLAIPLDEIQIDDKLYFNEEPVEIMDREVKRLKQSRIPIVKLRWNSRRGPEFIWEREDQMQKKYPHLFANSAPVKDVTS